MDHCKYSSVKNVKNPDSNEKMIFKKFDKCKVKYLNTKKFDDLTLETFAKLEKPKKKQEDDKKKISQDTKVENKIKKNYESKKDLE